MCKLLFTVFDIFDIFDISISQKTNKKEKWEELSPPICENCVPTFITIYDVYVILTVFGGIHILHNQRSL